MTHYDKIEVTPSKPMMMDLLMFSIPVGIGGVTSSSLITTS